MCSKGKGQAKTVVNVPAPGFLTADVLDRLPRKKEIGPNDSLSMVGTKRNRAEQLEAPAEINYDPSGSAEDDQE